MGEVLLAWDTTTGRHVALKVVSTRSLELRDRFIRDVHDLAKLEGEHTLWLFDHGSTRGPRRRVCRWAPAR